MRSWLFLLALPLLGGCTHTQLRHSTLSQVGTLTELQYRQVLNNVAMFAQNPHALPHFAMTSTGGAQVSDSGSANVALAWDPYRLVSEALSLGAGRSVSENWTLAAILDPDRLMAMRCAYQLALLNELEDCAECHKALVPYLGDNYLEQIPRGWFHVGCRLDVPREACYIGRFQHRWVWVTPEGLDRLTRFTLVILDIATAVPAPPPSEATKVVEAFFYDESGTLLVNKETQTVPVSAPVKAPIRSTPPIAPRMNYFSPLQSQIQLPRPQ